MSVLAWNRSAPAATSARALGVWALGFYIFLSHVFVPILSPLRAMGQLEPAELRNVLLPPLLGLLILICGPNNVLRPRSLLHIVLILVAVQAAILGFENYLYPLSQRDYFSHLFQLISGYVMLGVGWSIGATISARAWKLFALSALVSVIISTLWTVDALQSGDVGRYYTPAYALILVSTFAALGSNKMFGLSFVTALISNKRAVILSLFGLILHSGFYKRWQGWFQPRLHPLDRFAIGIITSLLVASAFALLVMWAANPENASTGLGKAANISYERMARSLEVGTASTTISDIDAGRTGEIDAAYASLEPVDIVFGSGAGWSVHVGGEKFVQNIHFTPLSLTAVFGAPFAAYIYIIIMWTTIRGTLSKTKRDSPTERMAPLYLGAAVVHSLFAYSLFIDWLVFFFVGVLQSSLKSQRSGGQVQQGIA